MLSQLTLSSQESIPEDLLQYWDFSADWLARKIPAFDDFERAKVAEFLTEYGIESPSAKMIGEVASYWFWWVTRDITKAVLRWIHEPLKAQKDSSQVTRLLQMTERYWSRINPRLTQYLLGRCAIIGWDKALPYLSRIELNPEALPDVRKTARDYRRLILNNPDKWKPLSEGSPEFSINETIKAAQRTLGLSPIPGGVPVLSN